MERYNNNDSISSKKISQINESNSAIFKGSISVSKLNGFLSEPFDSESAAIRCAKKGEKDPTYKYAGMTPEEIMQTWEDKANESKRYGSMLDDFAGLYLNNKEKEIALWKLDNNYEYDERLRNNCQGFLEFYNLLTTTTNYRYVSREMKLFAKSKLSENVVNGRFDCLFYDETTNSYIIIDWKTTEGISLKNEYGKVLKGPAYQLDQCEANLYTMQLQLYKKALVETYNLTEENKISIYVCNVLREKDESTGKYYKLIKSNFPYSSDFLDKCIDFACEKNKILNS